MMANLKSLKTVIDFLPKQVQSAIYTAYDHLFSVLITTALFIISIITSCYYNLSFLIGPFYASIITLMYIISLVLIITVLYYRVKICFKEYKNIENIKIIKEANTKTENEIINDPNNTNKILAAWSFERIDSDKAKNLIQLIAPNPQPIIDKMHKICNNKKEQYSHDEIDNFDKLFNECFHSYKSEKIRSLLLKAQQNIDQISKDTVLFLITLDDKKLEILKQQFKYVTGGTVILLYDDGNKVEKDFKDQGLNHPRCDDKLEFTNSIWLDRRREEKLNIPANHDYFVKISKHKSILIQNTQQIEMKFGLHYFRQLTQTGVEMYNLLKDQIGEIPNEYLEKVAHYHQKKYPDLQISLSSNTQSTQATQQA